MLTVVLFVLDLACRSERGFVTHTGTVAGVPISIVAIGMGFPNADFFVSVTRDIDKSVACEVDDGSPSCPLSLHGC